MSNNKQSTFRIVSVDFKNGLTFTTMSEKNKLHQQHFPMSVIESYFGGNKKK